MIPGGHEAIRALLFMEDVYYDQKTDDEWYHVWFPATGEYGFVRQNDLTEGNG